MRHLLIFWGSLIVLGLPVLACGNDLAQVTPTPTKTPRLIRTVEPISTQTLEETVLPTPTPVSDAAATDTPIPEPLPTDTPPPPSPPTDTPPPPPPPTNTPPPPPPPTNTPAPPPPPPPTNTPAPPPPTQPPANSGPQVIIELPGGDKYGLNDDVDIIITVRDPDGVASFEWGLFAQNESPLGLGGEQQCGGATECRIEEEFETKLPGQFFVGVEAVDTKGEDKTEIKQLYVG